MAVGYHHLADVQAVLVISQPWSNMIRSGFKTMELRSSSFRKYERQWIGLATSRSGALWGAARISKSTLLNSMLPSKLWYGIVLPPLSGIEGSIDVYSCTLAPAAIPKKCA